MYPVSVDKTNLTVTIKKQFEYSDIALFRAFGYRWDPAGEVTIQIRKTTKKAVYTTIRELFPFNRRLWAESYRVSLRDDIEECYKIFFEGFDNAVKDKAPIYQHAFEHQKECVRFQCYNQFSILSLEQGLGKSLSATIPSLILDTPITLIIVPNSLKYNWKEEMCVTWKERFGHGIPEDQVTILSSGKKSIIAKNERFIIVNYDVVAKYFDYIVERDVRRIIIDECHYIKNPHAARTKSIKNLVNKLNSLEHRCSVSFLSGTPAPNKIVDMFSYLDIARHIHGQNFKRFMNNFCYTQKTKFGIKITEAKNIEILSRDIENLMIRKLKSECLDLPPKQYIKINFENEKYDEQYDEVYNQLLQMLAQSGKQVNIDSCLSRLQVITSKAKVEPCVELAEQIMEDEVVLPDGRVRGKKVAIMCNFKEPLYMLKEIFGSKCVLLDGSVESEKRMELVNQFKKIDTVQVFLGQTTAAGVGLNLTECTDVIFLNFPYTRAEIEQAADRFHRIGQNGQVNVYFTVLTGKVDEMIYKIVVKKYRDISKLIDNKVDNTETSNVSVSEENEMLELFDRLKQEVGTDLTNKNEILI